MKTRPASHSAAKRIAASLFLAVMVVGVSADYAAAQSARCDAYARREANASADGGDVLGSGAAGAIGGAIVGGLLGGKRGLAPGAIIGGGVGIAGGAAGHSHRWRAVYEDAYEDCLDRASARRARPARAYGGGPAPEPWTREWYRYCSDKFQSFDPETGTYRTHGGETVLCQ